MTKIVLATRNEGKVVELARLFDDPRLELVSMKELVPDDFEVEETGTTFAENAWLKAEEVAEKTGLPALADDSGLEVDALDGRPGVYSARYAGPGASDDENNALLVRELAATERERRTARFVCVLALAIPGRGGVLERRAEARGVIEGRIVERPRGQGGFGYDPLFEPLEFPGVTTAELTPDRKNQISHRGGAARAIRSALSAYLDEASTAQTES